MLPLWAPRLTESGGEVGKAMAEPRIIDPDDAGAGAPDVAAFDAPAPDTNGHGPASGGVVRYLRPDDTPSLPSAPPGPLVPGPADPIAWLAPADPSFVVLRDDLRDDLYDDLREDLADDLRDDLRDELRGDLREDLRQDLHAALRTDLDADLDDLREDLYEEVDDLREDVFLDTHAGPATALPRAHFQTDAMFEQARARRVAFVAAAVLALVLSAAIVLLWQRAESAQIVASRPAPVATAPPDLDNALLRVDQLDQQLAALLAVSASPGAPNDVSLQIEALRLELSGVRGCLQAVRRAVNAGADTASAIEYC